MREVTALIRKLRKLGYEVRQGGRTGNHYKVYKGKHLITSMPCTPTDHRTIENIKKYLRKAGVEI